MGLSEKLGKLSRWKGKLKNGQINFFFELSFNFSSCRCYVEVEGVDNGTIHQHFLPKNFTKCSTKLYFNT